MERSGVISMFINKKELEDRLNHPNNMMNVLGIEMLRDKEDNKTDETNDDINGITETLNILTEDKETEVEIKDKIKASPAGEVTDAEIENFVTNGMVWNREDTREIGWQGMVKGDKHLPDVIRDVITIQGNFAAGRDVAKAWGVSEGTVSKYKNGMPVPHAPASLTNQRAQAVLSENVGRIRKTVEKKIMKTLNLLTEDKLVEEDARALSIIAKNLSSVLPAVEGRDLRLGMGINGNVNVQTIFYSPGQGSLEDYETIQG